MTADNTIRIADGGTPADTWTGWDRSFATLDIAACPELVIVAPHPDDETLGLGATAALLRDRGVRVHVVSVTDGGAAYPELDTAGRAELEAVRRVEARCATALLGVAEPIRLGLPDGELQSHEDQLTDALAAVLARFAPGTWCAATWRGDGHPDHEAVGRAAASVAPAHGAVFVEYPVWMWHWATPDDPSVPWHRARRIALTERALTTKTRAVQCFTSQIQASENGGPVLPPAVVDRFLRVGEVVFV